MIDLKPIKIVLQTDRHSERLRRRNLNFPMTRCLPVPSRPEVKLFARISSQFEPEDIPPIAFLPECFGICQHAVEGDGIGARVRDIIEFGGFCDRGIAVFVDQGDLGEVLLGPDPVVSEAHLNFF